MWFLPSRSRPPNVQRLIDCWWDLGATSPLMLCVDDDDPMLDSYRALLLPDGWELSVGPRGPLSDLYNQFFARYPSLDWYGFIADDVVPETREFDRLLIETAGTDGLAAPDDGISHERHAPHFVISGNLVREQGWLCLPGLDRIYIDTVWNDIAKERGVFRYRPDIVLRHWHFSNRKALMDLVYRKHNKPRDAELYSAWLNSLKGQS
jgi:hypothetical protein